MLLHLVAQSLDGSQAHGIFLCGDDALGRGETAEGVVDLLDIFLLEMMMVSEGQWMDVFGIRLQVESHLFRRGNTCQQKDVVGGEVFKPF